MGIEYVVNGEVCENVGQAIGKMKSVDSWKAKPRPKAAGSQRVHLASEATRSNGFTVTGFSPEHLVEAEKRRDRAEKEARSLLADGIRAKIPPPWDPDIYMRNAKPPKVRARPYELVDAADQCADLARKPGWLNVRIEQHLSRREDDLPPLF